MDTLLPERVYHHNPRVVKKPVSKFRSKRAKHRGTWQWKDAYEAVEVALILYLQRKGLPQNPLLELQLLESLCPTHTRRSEELS